MGKPVVLITGSSSGVGLELLKFLRERPYRIVATARPSSCARFASLGIQPSDSLSIKALDIADLDSHGAVIESVFSEWGQIDVLVNNAGISYRAAIEEMAPSEELDQMTVNYLGPMNLIRLVTPAMRSRRAGRIINVSSVGGMMAMPTMGSYSASKWALEGASEALWYELRPWDIKISLVQPGFINSDGFTKVRVPVAVADDPQKSAYRVYYESMSAFVTHVMTHSPSDAKDVARVILRTMEKKRPGLRVAGTWDAYFFNLLRRLMPRALYHRILYMGLPGKSKWGRNESNT